MRERIKLSLISLHKRRESGTETEITHLVGDVRDRVCLIVNDMISTGGTITRLASIARGFGRATAGQRNAALSG